MNEAWHPKCGHVAICMCVSVCDVWNAMQLLITVGVWGLTLALKLLHRLTEKPTHPPAPVGVCKCKPGNAGADWLTSWTRCYAVPWTRLLPVTLSGDCEIVALRQRAAS